MGNFYPAGAITGGPGRLRFESYRPQPAAATKARLSAIGQQPAAQIPRRAEPSAQGVLSAQGSGASSPTHLTRSRTRTSGTDQIASPRPIDTGLPVTWVTDYSANMGPHHAPRDDDPDAPTGSPDLPASTAPRHYPARCSTNRGPRPVRPQRALMPLESTGFRAPPAGLHATWDVGPAERCSRNGVHHWCAARDRDFCRRSLCNDTSMRLFSY